MAQRQVHAKLYSMNSELTDSSLLMRRMVSASSSATDSWRMRLQARASSRSGMVSVTTSSSSAEFVDALDRRARQHRVGAVGHHLLGAMLLQRLGRLAQRVGGIDHVVHDDAGAVLRRRR